LISCCIDQIKQALGISGKQLNNVTWQGSTGKKAAQVNLLIDRRDQIIDLCECKFSLETFEINKT